MSETIANQPKISSNAYGYFVLSVCLLVPTIGTLMFLVFLDHLGPERLAIGGAVCIYLISVVLGLFSTKRFWKHYGRAEFWALITGIILNGVSGLVAAGALVLINAAAALHLH